MTVRSKWSLCISYYKLQYGTKWSLLNSFNFQSAEYSRLDLGDQIWPKERQYGFTVTFPSIINNQGMLQQEGKCIFVHP